MSTHWLWRPGALVNHSVVVEYPLYRVPDVRSSVEGRLALVEPEERGGGLGALAGEDTRVVLVGRDLARCHVIVRVDLSFFWRRVNSASGVEDSSFD